ncbi:MAG TPA: hypothetical protein VEG26_04565 [Steroidobacteraceae bacterium]|nr:hypothetical protein [Steroidobacteraceae bacterium]
MSEATPGSVLEAQVGAMLQRVRDGQERRLRELRAAAAAQSQEILRGARAEARGNLHQAVVRERMRMAQGLRQAEARAELESRQRAQVETLTLLRSMWAHIGAELEGRWSDGGQRGAWIAATVQQARRLFAGQEWRIEHARGVSSEQQRAAQAEGHADGARRVEWVAEPSLRAGLRIRTPGACLDATVEGLLAERAEIEAAFLSEYLAVGGRMTAEPAGPASPPPRSQEPPA